MVFALAGICAGAALLPDWDHPKATVARSLGPLSLFIALGLEGLSAWAYLRTRTRRDQPNRHPHRTLTHTGAAALVAGALSALLVALGGAVVVFVLLFVLLGLAMRGLLGRLWRRSGWIPTTAVTVIVAGYTVSTLNTHTPTAGIWIGIAVTVGMLAHLAGDAITDSGVPIAWPFVIAGRRWWRLQLPDPWRLATGSATELFAIMPTLALATFSAAILMT